jgi:hypothetical protein
MFCETNYSVYVRCVVPRVKRIQVCRIIMFCHTNVCLRVLLCVCVCACVCVCVLFRITLRSPPAVWYRRVHHYTQHFITHLVNLCVFSSRKYYARGSYENLPGLGFKLFYIRLHLLKDGFPISKMVTQDNVVDLYSVRGRSEKLYRLCQQLETLSIT